MHPFCHLMLRCACCVLSLLAEEEVPLTLKSQKTERLFDSPFVTIDAPLSAQLSNSSLLISLPDYSQGGLYPRRLPVLHAGSVQLLSAEQALAAAADGTAIARAVCVRQR